MVVIIINQPSRRHPFFRFENHKAERVSHLPVVVPLCPLVIQSDYPPSSDKWIFPLPGFDYRRDPEGTIFLFFLIF